MKRGVFTQSISIGVFLGIKPLLIEKSKHQFRDVSNLNLNFHDLSDYYKYAGEVMFIRKENSIRKVKPIVLRNSHIL